jgi:hypothetical protein
LDHIESLVPTSPLLMHGDDKKIVKIFLEVRDETMYLFQVLNFQFQGFHLNMNVSAKWGASR